MSNATFNIHFYDRVIRYLDNALRHDFKPETIPLSVAIRTYYERCVFDFGKYVLDDISIKENGGDGMGKDRLCLRFFDQEADVYKYIYIDLGSNVDRLCRTSQGRLDFAYHLLKVIQERTIDGGEFYETLGESIADRIDSDNHRHPLPKIQHDEHVWIMYLEDCLSKYYETEDSDQSQLKHFFYNAFIDCFRKLREDGKIHPHFDFWIRVVGSRDGKGIELYLKYKELFGERKPIEFDVPYTITPELLKQTGCLYSIGYLYADDALKGKRYFLSVVHWLDVMYDLVMYFYREGKKGKEYVKEEEIKKILLTKKDKG